MMDIPNYFYTSCKNMKHVEKLMEHVEGVTDKVREHVEGVMKKMVIDQVLYNQLFKIQGMQLHLLLILYLMMRLPHYLLS